MSELESQLCRCLRAVFPHLADDELARASVDTVAEWDSLHAVVLVAVVEEKFGVKVPARDYPQLRSYAQLLKYLRHAVARPVQ